MSHIVCFFHSSVIDVQEERYEHRRLAAPPKAGREASESSGESADEYVQAKPSKKKKIRRREEGEGRSEKRKRKRKPVIVEEENLEELTPEQGE